MMQTIRYFYICSDFICLSHKMQHDWCNVVLGQPKQIRKTTLV